MRNSIGITSSNTLASPANQINKVFSYPVCNIAESAEQLQIVLEIPGYKYDDIAVHIGQSRLFVSGNRKEDYGDKNRIHMVTERLASFRWVYDLKVIVGKEDLHIALENGFLFITVKKKCKTMPPPIDFVTMQMLVNDTASWPRTNIV